MSRLFGFVINDAQRVACALYPAREALVVASAPEGWGLASYQGGEVLLQRHPKPVVGPLDFYRAAREQRTDYMVGHVREGGTPAKLENTQPFRFRSWVFGCSGGLSAARSGPAQPGAAGVLEQVPDFLRRNIRGQDPAEALFHLFLSFLHDANRLDDPNVKPADVAGALKTALGIAERAAVEAGAQPVPANVIATNGRILLAARNGLPLWVRQVNGIHDCAVCAAATAEEAKRERRRTSHEHVKAVLVVSEPAHLPEVGFEEVPDATILSVNREIEKSAVPLRG
jgi:Glutamine amidotransferases class-II